ncbi:hypothetical protein SAMD00019534_059300, partial [Acytostelium subglobosum LB1]|uniref:hypothetical protein n=1 Tax=Acytostelium subglobosum LB1 TaxID=1410327 RepID=UPI000644DB9C
IDMDNERAHRLNDIGTTLLCLNVPEGTQVALDNKQMVSGPSFKGFKMIPHGAHIFCYSAADQTNNVSPPSVQSRFFYVDERKQPGRVIILKWSTELEDFVDEHSSSQLQQQQQQQQHGGLDGSSPTLSQQSAILTQQEIESYTMAVKKLEFDRNLAPYPIDDNCHFQWLALTSHITQSLLDRIMPISGVINGDADDYENAQDNRRPRMPDAKEAEILAKLDRDLNEFRKLRNPQHQHEQSEQLEEDEAKTTKERWGVPYYSVLSRAPSKGSTPTEISMWNMDKSHSLRTVIKRYYAADEYGLIGEIQFCYVLFIYGLAYGSFLQWKNLVTLMLQCDAMVDSNPRLFTTFLRVLQHQMEVGPADMFDSDISSNMFLKPLLKGFIESNFDEIGGSGKVNDKDNDKRQLFEQVLAIRRMVENKFKWNLTLFEIGMDDNNQDHYMGEDNEDLPVVVYEDDVT